MSEYLDLLRRCLTASIYDESSWTLIEGPMQSERSVGAMLKRFAVNALRQRGILLIRARKFDQQSRDQGLDWPLFGFTMVGTKRLNNIEHCISDVVAKNVPGDFVETGVWRGGSSIWAKAMLRHYGANDRTVWCCDSFEGMPKPGAKDISIDPGSDFSDRNYLVASLETVKENFAKFGLLDERVRFLKGWFCDTLPLAPIEQIAVLRMDGDLYASTRDVLINLYDKVSPGGYVIVDDYGSWSGCRQAVDEFRAERGISDPLVPIDTDSMYWRIGG